MVITCHPSLHVLDLTTTSLFLLLLILSPLVTSIATASSSSSSSGDHPFERVMMTTRRRRMVVVVARERDKGLIVEEKTRLGSTPPSCHNKCNQCHPCWAVQVPTLPNHDLEQLLNIRQQQESNKSNKKEKKMMLRRKEMFPFELYQSEREASGRSRGSMYTNYKPLGWKCHCRGHFYNA